MVSFRAHHRCPLVPLSAKMPGSTNRIDVETDGNAPHERTYLDAEGARWRVFEQPFADYDRRSGMSLIFSSDSAVRRVRDYPAAWMDLTDAELAALSWKA
ncbi:MAG TPA: hypothetical protein VMZ90_12085 [Vicinamibacterales bacterium]|nr:hypothetical protein [Vicinamibacterales bacterium]